MKESPKPWLKESTPIITTGQPHEKSRDVFSGKDAIAKFFPFASFFMYVLRLFTIPVEILLRHRFGQRWFTTGNFFVGLFVMSIFWGIEALLIWIAHSKPYDWLVSFFSIKNPPLAIYYWTNGSLGGFTLIYVGLGLYQLFRTWWRSRTGASLHSYDDGRSRLARPLHHLITFINWCMKLFMREMMTKEEKARLATVPKFIADDRAFTTRVIEPCFLLWVAYDSRREIVFSLWMGLSGFAWAIYGNWKENIRRGRMLDRQDAKIEAEIMRQEHEAQLALENAGENQGNVEKPQLTITLAAIKYPDVQTIISEMNRDRTQPAMVLGLVEALDNNLRDK